MGGAINHGLGQGLQDPGGSLPPYPTPEEQSRAHEPPIHNLFNARSVAVHGEGSTRCFSPHPMMPPRERWCEAAAPRLGGEPRSAQHCPIAPCKHELAAAPLLPLSRTPPRTAASRRSPPLTGDAGDPRERSRDPQLGLGTALPTPTIL